jgi:putative endonuclease
MTRSDDARPRTRSAQTGKAGEDAAARYLAASGCIIEARNWHAHPGEIDLIARCPTPGSEQSTLCFVEVRARHGRRGLAEESISRRKALNMVASAYAYMEANGIDAGSTLWRIDLVAVSMSDQRVVDVNWVQGAVDEQLLEG